MRNTIKSAGREKIATITYPDWYLEDHDVFKDELTIFAQNPSNFINIFTGNFGMKHDNHDVVIKFYEKEKGGK